MKLPPARTVRKWSALAAVLVARAVMSCLVGLLLWAIVPAVLGWTNTVVQSGSMAPGLEPGDVVSFARDGEPKAGQVVLVDDPAEPGRLLSHRVTDVLADGSLVTRGDANGSADSTPVPRDSYLGTARLRVPWVGLPVLWWRERQYFLVALSVVVIGLVVVLAVPKTVRTASVD